MSTPFRVAFAFGLFGAGSLAVVLLLLPVRVVASRDVADGVAQELVARAFRLFLAIGRGLGLWRIEIEGAEHLRTRPCLVVSNHPTLIDVVLLIARIGRIDCVVKSAAWRNPFLSGIVRLTGYIPNDGGEQTVDACVDRLAAGRSVLLFPEGSRSPAGGLRPFQRGAAHVALRAERPVVLAFVECRPRALGKDQRLRDYPAAGIDVRIRVDRPRPVSEWVDDDAPRALRVRHLSQRWLDAYEAWLRRAKA